MYPRWERQPVHFPPLSFENCLLPAVVITCPEIVLMARNSSPLSSITKKTFTCFGLSSYSNSENWTRTPPNLLGRTAIFAFSAYLSSPSAGGAVFWCFRASPADDFRPAARATRRYKSQSRRLALLQFTAQPPAIDPANLGHFGRNDFSAMKDARRSNHR